MQFQMPVGCSKTYCIFFCDLIEVRSIFSDSIISFNFKELIVKHFNREKRGIGRDQYCPKYVSWDTNPRVVDHYNEPLLM